MLDEPKTQPRMQVSPQPKKTGSKFILGVIIALVVVVLVGAGGFGWYYYYGPCGVQTIKAALPGLEKVATRFDDANQLASSTPRIALAGPIGELQSIKRDASELEVPACMTKSKSLLVKGMQTTIDGYIAFVGKESDSAVNAKFSNAKWQLSLFADELKAVQACAPFCKNDNYDAAQ